VLPLIHSLLEWASRPAVLTVLFVSSGFSLVASVIALPWYLKRLPADYFVRRTPARVQTSPALSQVAFLLLKNVVGGLLVLAGIAMLVLPGQGIATIVVGLLMMQFPGKRRIERRVLSIPVVLRAVNTLRKRSGEPDLIMPPPSRVAAMPTAAPSEPQPHSVR
jgi:hypothetical protein